MKKYEVIWSYTAKLALREIVDYIQKDNKSAAKKFLDTVLKKVTQLETFPKSGRVVPEFQIEYLREIIHEKYRIVYEIHKNSVSILTVFHGKRLLELSDLERRP